MRKKSKRNRKQSYGKFYLIYPIAVFVIILDQLIKSLALKITESIVVIRGVLKFTLVKNTGATWGMLQGQGTLLLFMGIFILCLVFFFLKEFKDKPYVNIALGLLIGGTIGNIIDRLFRGFVIDFIDFGFWPVFNIADSCVFVSAFLLIFYFMYEKD